MSAGTPALEHLSAAGPTVALTLARFTPQSRTDWLETAARVLSAEENADLKAIADADKRTQHAIGRALIRLAAADAGAGPAGRVGVVLSTAGKPELANLPTLGVSVAHCTGLVALATCNGAAVGVDVERIRADGTMARKLARRYFSAQESETASELPEETVAVWFARCWTIKEAVGKALGVGMIPALSGAVVSGDADNTMLADTTSGPPAEAWTVHQLVAPQGGERIAIAIPAPAVALSGMRELTLRAFARACA